MKFSTIFRTHRIVATPLLISAVTLSPVSARLAHAEDPAVQALPNQPAENTMNETTPKLDDGQIAKIVRTANDGEIQQAELAEKKASDPSVKRFARMMIRQHTDVNSKLGRVTKTEHLNLADSSASSELKNGADKTYGDLKGLKGADFDRAYVDAQVKAHQGVLNSIDGQLMPNAKDEKLQSMLKDTRPAVQQHLDHALSLQAKLLKKSADKMTGQG